MKKLGLSILTSICLFTSLNAYDNYARYSILYSVPSDLEVKSGSDKSEIGLSTAYSFEVGLGFGLSDNFTLETQYTYNTAKMEEGKGDMDIHSLFINGIYNIKLDTSLIHPYLGIGVGPASYSLKSDNDVVLGYQGFFGTAFDFEPNIQTYIEYKYKKFNDVQLDNISYENTNIHAIGVGVKTKF
ncbi:outer membrane beta-barrel protein [Poseidonibacter lekithochrous]|uniref:outer membrane protein n=1 Tax=Poseidonibacter TaxID=2321187 RepID=UPI001C09FFED|nr:MULTISPECIES: outer membrane beta-barrel protein [Poseidonibacter]MBU3014451.1 outer membrane beta-barrel protein [Poseidonibacter lekithochrous]MDO6827749.1 outer membrane beta-barrel protein [Poseidonibacter sp. 1_MG-2023]